MSSAQLRLLTGVDRASGGHLAVALPLLNGQSS